MENHLIPEVSPEADIASEILHLETRLEKVRKRRYLEELRLEVAREEQRLLDVQSSHVHPHAIASLTSATTPPLLEDHHSPRMRGIKQEQPEALQLHHEQHPIASCGLREDLPAKRSQSESPDLNFLGPFRNEQRPVAPGYSSPETRPVKRSRRQSPDMGFPEPNHPEQAGNGERNGIDEIEDEIDSNYKDKTRDESENSPTDKKEDRSESKNQVMNSETLHPELSTQIDYEMLVSQLEKHFTANRGFYATNSAKINEAFCHVAPHTRKAWFSRLELGTEPTWTNFRALLRHEVRCNMERWKAEILYQNARQGRNQSVREFVRDLQHWYGHMLVYKPTRERTRHIWDRLRPDVRDKASSMQSSIGVSSCREFIARLVAVDNQTKQ